MGLANGVYRHRARRPAVGLLLVAALPPPQEHPRLSRRSSPTSKATRPIRRSEIPWLDLLPFRQTWAFAIGKFLTDSIWWFYLFWFAKFMNDQFGVDIKTIGLPMITVYLLADVGSIAGGWQSSRLLERGWTANAARKTAMLTCALCVVPVAAAPLVVTTNAGSIADAR